MDHHDDDEGVCAECGVKHGPEISETVLGLYREILDCTDPVERRQLMVDMACEFALDVDSVDLTTPEGLHTLADDLHQKRMAFEQAALRLGRIVFPLVETAAAAHPSTVDPNRKPN